MPLFSRAILYRLLVAAAFALAGTIAPWNAASAKKVKILHAFCSIYPGCYDGEYPTGNFTLDSNGNLFGTTDGGGARGVGTLYEMERRPGKAGGKFRVLYNFCQCAEGYGVEGKVVFDASGNIYGAAGGGGSAGEGVVFELTPNVTRKHWTLHVLHDFCVRNSSCPDGTQPSSGLTYAGATEGLPYDGISPLYGTTFSGGRHHGGVAYSISPSGNGRWTQKTLYAFCQEADCADGRAPETLVANASGDLFGTTLDGGGNDADINRVGAGTAFRLSPGSDSSWSETVLYRFCSQGQGCADGEYPRGIVFDQSGNMFGLALGGRSGVTCAPYCGIVFKIAADGSYSTSYQFCALDACADGFEPSALYLDPVGNLFGTAGGGGRYNAGTIFTLNGTLSVLHSFCAEANCPDGGGPEGLAGDTAGYLFGVTGNKGEFGNGTIFALTP